MSRNFLHCTRYFFQYRNNLFFDNFIYIPIISGTVSFHLVYTVTSKRSKNIYIKDKYMFTQNGFTNFMVVDQKGNHYNVNNSLWFWKWDSLEDWTKLKPNDHIRIEYYGYRVPFFASFPNIVSSSAIVL